MSTGHRDKWDLLEEMVNAGAQPGTVAYGKLEGRLHVTCVEDVEKAVLKLESAITRSADLSDSLGRKVFWLNVVLTIATAVGAFATVYQVIK